MEPKAVAKMQDPPALAIREGFDPVTAKYLIRQDTAARAKSVVDRVSRVRETRRGGSAVIKASCSRGCSLKDPYLVYLEVDAKERSLMVAHCTCVAGQEADCKHIYALIDYVNSHGGG